MVVGIALSSTSYVVVLGAVAQVVPEHKRSTTFGIITAAGSFGMFAVVPGIQWLIAFQSSLIQCKMIRIDHFSLFIYFPIVVEIII